MYIGFNIILQRIIIVFPAISFSIVISIHNPRNLNFFEFLLLIRLLIYINMVESEVISYEYQQKCNFWESINIRKSLF